MNTSDVIKDYLAARRGQGVQIRSGARALRQFARETGDLPLHEVTPVAVATFLLGHGTLSAAWTTKFRLLTGLYRFALARGYVAASPMPTAEFKPKLPPPQTPYVYSNDELQRLLDATATLKSACSGLQATTYRTLLLVLYGAGLRISEALGLTVADVNLAERVLTVRNTKFYKSRLVPIGVQLATTLTTYYDQRSTLPMLKGNDSAFLCSRSGGRLTYQCVVTLFQRVRSAAGIACKDVQQLLPHLATYLGHACIASTQRYLQMTPELLQEASCRFAAYAQQEATQEVNHA